MAAWGGNIDTGEIYQSGTIFNITEPRGGGGGGYDHVKFSSGYDAGGPGYINSTDGKMRDGSYSPVVLFSTNMTGNERKSFPYYHFDGGILTKNLDIRGARLGQGVKINVTNGNSFGTPLNVTANDETKSLYLPLFKSYSFKFTSGGEEPQPWNINISIDVDAFIILYEIKSTWVHGVPLNR